MTARRSLSLLLGLVLTLGLLAPTTALAKDLERTRVSLVNTGEDGDASGHAEYRVRKKNRSSFKVEAEDLDPANYDVTVGGIVQGVLDVRVLRDGRVQGEIEFDTKSQRNKQPLDFDPRGQLITVERAGIVYLQVVFPPSTGGTGTGSCPQ
ncbi:MAG: hypothetical protein R3F35_11900 [Myxococcota bacterium]